MPHFMLKYYQQISIADESWTVAYLAVFKILPDYNILPLITFYLSY